MNHRILTNLLLILIGTLVILLLACAGAFGGGEGLDLPVELPERSEPEEAEKDKPDEEPPPVFYDEEIPIKTGLTYVIDRSGSMIQQTQPYVDAEGQVQRGNTKMDRAKFELKKSIYSLDETYTFNVLAFFSCSQIMCFSGKKRATKANKAKAAAWIDQLRPNGNTGTAPAVLKALAQENDTIVLLTDGQPNLCPGMAGYDDFFTGPRARPKYGKAWTPEYYHANISGTENTIVQACLAKDVKCHCFGIKDYGMWQQMLKNIASKTGGSYVHID